MRRIAPLFVGLGGLLAACGQGSAPPIGSAPAEKAPPVSAAAADGPPAFVGRWAVNRAGCERRAWVFRSGGLQSPGVLNCQFAHVEPTSAGYTVASICSDGKTQQEPTRIVVTLTGKGRTRFLTLSSGPFSEPLALSWCGAELDESQAGGAGQG